MKILLLSIFVISYLSACAHNISEEVISWPAYGKEGNSSSINNGVRPNTEIVKPSRKF